MKNIYVTVVFPNGQVVQFRQRDIGYNRFKVSHHELNKEFKEAYPEIDNDDCNGEELATFLRFVNEKDSTT